MVGEVDKGIPVQNAKIYSIYSGLGIIVMFPRYTTSSAMILYNTSSGLGFVCSYHSIRVTYLDVAITQMLRVGNIYLHPFPIVHFWAIFHLSCR